jgi:hypothetical protein
MVWLDVTPLGWVVQECPGKEVAKHLSQWKWLGVVQFQLPGKQESEWELEWWREQMLG